MLDGWWRDERRSAPAKEHGLLSHSVPMARNRRAATLRLPLLYPTLVRRVCNGPEVSTDTRRFSARLAAHARLACRRLAALALLTLLCPTASGQITVVGDDDQAIYAFQGATGSFAPFEAAYPKFIRILLEANYRSTSTIVEASSFLVARNSDRVPKRVYSTGGHGHRIIVAACRTPADEARYLISSIRSYRGRLLERVYPSAPR